MHEALKKLAEKRRAKAETDIETYRALVGRLAVKATLSDADLLKLEQVSDRLGKSGEQIEADAALFVELAALDATYATRDERRAAMTQAREKAAAHEAETKRLEEEHAKLMMTRAEEGRSLDWSVTEAVQAHESAIAAGNDARKLRARHTRLLGEQPPLAREEFVAGEYKLKPVAGMSGLERERFGLHPKDPLYSGGQPANVFHLAHGLEGTPSDGHRHRLIFLEAVLRNPEHWGQLAGVEFVPMPGQGAADLRRLVDWVRAALRGDLQRPTYLLSRQDVADARYPKLQPHFDSLRMFVEDTRGQTIEPGQFNILLHPGQSEDDLKALVERWRKDVEARTRRPAPSTW